MLLPLQDQFVGDGHSLSFRRLPDACDALILRSGHLAASRRMKSGAKSPSWFETRAKSALLTMRTSINRPDQILDLLGMRAEILGELVEIGIGDLLEARLVDIGHDLDADFLKLGGRCPFQVEGPLGFLQADVPRRRLHPSPLLGIETLPKLVADPEDGVVGFVLGDR